MVIDIALKGECFARARLSIGEYGSVIPLYELADEGVDLAVAVDGFRGGVGVMDHIELYAFGLVSRQFDDYFIGLGIGGDDACLWLGRFDLDADADAGILYHLFIFYTAITGNKTVLIT